MALGQCFVIGAACAQSVAPAAATVQDNGLAVLQAPNIIISPQHASDKDDAQSVEPRIMRGSDQVLNIEKSAPIAKGTPVSFRFEEAPVAEVVRTVLGDILKLDYVVHPPLQGTVTLTTPSPIDADKAVFLLEAALQANGLVMVRDARGTYQVGKPEALRSLVGNVRLAGAPGSMAPGYGIIVVPLQYIGATEMSNILKPIVSQEAIIKVDSVRNVLVMQGSRTQSEGWMDLVKTFDVDLLKGMSVGIYPLKYASIEEVSAALQIINGSGQGQTPSSAGAVGRPNTPSRAGATINAGSAAASSGAATGSGAQLGGNAAAAAALLSSLGDSNPLYGALRVLPIPRLNAVMVITPRASYLDEAEKWIRRLDVPGYGGTEPELYVYRVQNGNAKYLAQVLNGIFGGQQAGATGNMTSGVAPGLNNANRNTGLGGNSYGSNSWGGGSGVSSGGGFGNRFGGQSGQQQAGAPTITATAIGDIRVVADEFNNTILVWATGSQFRKIEASLKRLDVTPIQVLIEASIIEVALTDKLEYGVEWLFKNNGLGGAGRDYTGFGNFGGLASDGAGNSHGALGSRDAPNFTYSIFNGTGIAARLSAIAGKGQVKMLSSPSVMVMDNHPASITVGDQIPVKSADYYTGTNNSGTVTNYQLKDTGVILNVTPSVNSGNMVSLQIDQAVIDAGKEDPVTGQTQFSNRQITTKLAVRSGEAIVMGGLIKDKTTDTNSGVPLLKDIPILGKAFSSTSKNKDRTELLLVMTPRVVRTDIDVREVSDELRDRLRGLDDDDLLGRVKKGNHRDTSGNPIQPLSAP